MIALVLIVVGVALFTKTKVKRRGAAVIAGAFGGGIFGLLGLVILALAILSLLLGIAIGATLFSGIALGPMPYQIVVQPWQLALLLAGVGIAFMFLGSKAKHGGARRG